MPNTLNILCAENLKDDYDLILIVLQKADINVFSQRVENAVEFKKALESDIKWDVILSDYVMPGFSGLEAINIFKTYKLNIPFIVVSGSITDIEAVAILKAGANDYVNKEKLLRLPSAILREIEQAKIRLELKESENRWKIALEGTTDGLWDINFKTNKIFYSKEWKAMLGYKDHEIENKEQVWHDLVHPDDLKYTLDQTQLHIDNKVPAFHNEYRMRCKDGTYKWILDRGKVVERTPEGEPLRMMGIHSDIDERKKLENTVKHIEKNLTLKIGKNYYTFLAKELNKTLKADYIIINKFNFKDNTGTSLAHISKKEVLPNITYDLTHSPCKIVSEKGFAYYESKVADAFVEDIYLIDMNVEAYMGLAIHNNNNECIGSLTAMYCHHTSRDNYFDTLMQFFADKIGSEMERNTLIDKVYKQQEELLNAQEIAQLGSYNLDLRTWKATTSAIFDKITGFGIKTTKSFKEWRKITHPDDADANQKMLENCIKTGAVWEREYRIITANKKEIKWIYGKSEILFKNKVATHLVGVIQDITKHKEAKLSLEKSKEIIIESEKKFRELYEKSGDAILIIKNGYFIDCNKAAIALLNYRAKEEFLNAHPSKLSPEIQANGHSSYNEAEKMMAIALKKGTHRFEWLHTKSNGEMFPVEVLLTTISKSSNNSVIHCVWRDITERKLNEVKIKNNTQKLLEFQKIASLGTFVFDKKTNLFETGSICNAILGIDITYKRDFKGWINLVHPKDSKKVQTILKNNSIKTIFNEIRMIRPIDKKVIWVYTRMVKEFDSKGKVFKIAGTIQDITSRKRSELTQNIIYTITKKASYSFNLAELFTVIRQELSQLFDTSNFFIALYNDLTDMISTPYMVDEQDDGSDFPKGETLTGYLIDHKKPILANYKDLLDLKEKNKISVLGPLSKCWLGVPLISNDKVIGAIVTQSYTDSTAYTKEDLTLLELIANNISQTIKQSQDLERIHLLNQTLIQSLNAVIVTNLQGLIEYVNPAFIDQTSYFLEEVIGKNPNILKSSIQTKEFSENLWKTISSGKVWVGEFSNKRKDGSIYLVEANISAVKNKEGEITNFISIQEDITEKRKLERDFLHAFIDAQEVEKQSFGEELHDGISQILSAQSMFIDVLKTLIKEKEGKIPEYLDRVKEFNLSAINEARNISHGLMSKKLKESGLFVAVEQICIDYCESRDIDFIYSCKGIKEEEINTKIKSNIFRIIQEISTNTVRHSLAKTAYISLSKTAKNQLKVIIKDDGVGIDFERNKANNKGAGLENIKRRMTLLNGKVNLKSEIDIGTQYTLLIPLDSVV